jgi:hypothetical protein
MAKVSDELKQKMIDAIRSEDLCIQDRLTGKYYVMFNEIVLSVGGREVHLKKDGTHVSTIDLGQIPEEGETISLRGIMGFAEFSM